MLQRDSECEYRDVCSLTVCNGRYHCGLCSHLNQITTTNPCVGLGEGGAEIIIYTLLSEACSFGEVDGRRETDQSLLMTLLSSL